MRIKKPDSKPPLIVILGPTASGKTKLAVRLASKFNGEIVSADSRQVYKGMDIGTGKDLPDYNYQGRKIPYHLIDVAEPGHNFSVGRYQKLAYQAIDNIIARKKQPFLVGGSPLYLKAIMDGIILPSAQPDPELREKLNKMDSQKRLALLKKLDPESLKKIDLKNPRRVVRAIEIAKTGGQKFSAMSEQNNPRYALLVLGLYYPIDVIRKKIENRVKKEIASGLVEEVYSLHQNGLSWERLNGFGLEYRYVSEHLRGNLNKKEMQEKLILAVGQFAKKQMTWFKKDKRIKWLWPA